MQTDRKSIIVFGAGKTAIKQYEWAAFAGYQVLFYVDNDSAKWGKAIGSLLVYSPAILNEYNCTIVFQDLYGKEIESQLEEMSYRGRKISFSQLKKEAVCRSNFDIELPKVQIKKETCFVFDTYFSVPSWGGTERWSCMVAKGLSDLGVRTCLICGENSRFDEFSDCCLHFPEENEIEMIKKIAAKIVEYLPCVFVSRASIALYAARIIKSIFPNQIRLIAVAHGDEEGIYNILSYWSDRIDKIICISKRIYNKFQKQYGLGEDTLLYRPNPIQVSPIFSRKKISTESVKIGFAARLSKEAKRTYLLPEIIEGCMKKKLNVEFNIAGEGECLDQLLAYVTDRHLESRVHVLGWVAPRDMDDFWRRQDIYLNISDHEGMSLAMLEAMSQGAIPVVTNVSGVADLIEDGKNGFVVPIGNWMDVVDKIEFICKNRECVEKVRDYNRNLIEEKCNLHDYVKWMLETL
nr:glycosyltransferase family 4 protein [uncultured Acetatifactor sp.]